VLGFSKAAEPASEFGADSLCIFLRSLERGRFEFRHVALGADDGAYRPGAAFGAGGVALGQRLADCLKQRAQGLFAGHRPDLLPQTQLSTMPKT